MGLPIGSPINQQPMQGPPSPMGASTPPFNPSIQGATPGADDPVRKLIEMVMQASKGKQQLAQPVPAPAPLSQLGGVSGIPPGMHGDKGADILGALSSLVIGGVAAHKRSEMAKAESFWNQLNTAVQSGNQEQITALLSDPKNTKRAAKALNQDWLNPEKTDVWREALNKTIAGQKNKDQAAHGLKEMFQKLIGKATQPQLDAGQKQQMAQEMMRKAPMQQSQPDPVKVATAFKDYAEGIKALRPEEPKTLEQAWLKSFKTENGREPDPHEIEGHYEAIRTKPVDALINSGIQAAQAGDQATAKSLFGLASQASGAKKGPPSGQSMLGVISKANSGDPEAQGQLKTWVTMQKELAQARGVAFGMGRSMYQIGAYYDNQGNLIPMTNFDAANRLKAGEQLTPSGRLSPKDAIAVQQFQSEMGSLIKGTPGGKGQTAIPGLRDNLKAFDNPGDRAIFARVMAASGSPTYGQESSWMGNVLNQVMTRDNVIGLSPDGRKLVVSLRRLNETVGRMRSVLGLPSTDNAMQMTLALVPGPQTPDSAFAGMLVDNIEQMGKQATGIPTFRGVAPQDGAPPSGAKVRDFTDIK